ncbi:hypothetical protein FSP39_003828 [Pinctada imbricata]|uniref:Calx-beta domain-containing protein n=1 Tax=Pinctada imbricata TaxID=66713 RepID=A0AA88YLJ0_PINIB|nr:hypothetical protein FSP39_003828 [Pinctada imbricata]
MALSHGTYQWLKTLRFLTWAFVVKWITVLAPFHLTCAQVGKIKEADILVLNRGIEVPFGRTAYLDPLQNLTINVLAGDRCHVTVLQNDPLSQRPGALFPTVFPCQFGPRQVYYSHFGSRSPSTDTVRLMIRYDSNTHTYIIPFTISVKVLFVQLEVLTKNMPLRVERLLGSSDAINRKNTQFSYDSDNQICRVTILSRKTGLPRYGHILNETSQLSMIDCDAFTNMGIIYQHVASTNSPDRDYIPMVLEISDRDGTVMKEEYFKKPVIIREGLQNTQPQPSIDAFLVMEVSNGNAIDQFVMTSIPPQVLSADDIETPSEQLIFNITRPLRFGQGEIVSTDNRNLPIKSFYQKDIQDLKIAYKPPGSDSNVLRTFSVEMQVVDAEGLTSPPFTLMIIVKPMNTMAPVATTNTGIQLFEGQSRELLSAQNLRISDEDNLDDVKIFVADGVRHGQLRLPPGRGYFTPADLDAGNIVYQHDGSDTYSDNVVFRMTDGQNEVQFLFPITIYPLDDQPPVLTVNTGLEITKNQERALSRFVLSATDIDSEDSEILFTLQKPYSREGVFVKKQFQVPKDLQNWQFINKLYEKVVDKFTQQDVDDNKIFYRHIGQHRPNVVIDRIRFRLSDTAEPPNESNVFAFVIKIQPLDDQQPYVHPNTQLRLEVDENQFLPLKRKFLRYTDDDTDDRQLQYIITKPPYDTDPRSRISAGSVVLCDSPGTVISMFSQEQVNHHKICYKAPDSEVGLSKRVLQFDFDVEDTNGNVLRNQKFEMIINPINNKPPIVTNVGFSVNENGRTVLTPQIIDVRDPDSDISSVRFVVAEVPYYGTLNNLQESLTVGDSFKRQDILNRNIVYINAGHEMDKDRFTLIVTDSVHRIPAIINIDVISVDDESPTLIGVQGGVLSLELNVKEKGKVQLSNKDIQATDVDTNNMTLTFIVEKYPGSGILTVRGRRVDRFTQKDIIDGQVYYEHRGGEIGKEVQNDTFTLALSDKSTRYLVSGNTVNRVEALVKIQPVDDMAPQVILGPTYEVLESNKQPILPRHLDVYDDDTDDEKLQCVITRQPSYGYVETISSAPGSEKSRVGVPLTAFFVRDLRIGNVNYVQSVHKGTENRRDGLRFFCSDGMNVSPEYNFPISIYPNNDEAPMVYTREFVVMEGLELKIDTPILKATDADVPPDELTFIITRKPLHGQILQQRNLAGTFPISQFKMADIEHSSTIMYQHDDTETTQDSFSFIVTDGKHNVSQTIPIIILPVDDETPRLSVNNGLDIKKVGETKFITKNDLKAEDLDSPDSNITYILRKMPKQGYLLKNDGSVISNLTLGMNFTQFNIDNRHIQYIHTGTEGTRDLIKFDVTDGLNPLIDRYFYVNIVGLDTIFPRVVTRGIELPEGGTVALTTDILSSSDLNSPDENLRYTITNAPQHGFLESTDAIGTPITTFTQLDVAGNKIRYVHDSTSETKMDRFEFEVTDGFNPVMRTFRIAISDVDNKRPMLIFNTLRVMEGGNKIVTPFELRAVDKDTPSDKLIFTITQVPLYGNILLNFSKTVHTFTYKDLEDNSISYQHDGTETTKDSFSVTITDGTHSHFYVFYDTRVPTKFPQTMHIEIVPVDNGLPQISVNKGIQSLNELSNGQLGVVLTNAVLQTTDMDSPEGSLTYLLTARPEHGYITHDDTGNTSITTWTQGDIDDMKIKYVLNPGSNASGDTFFFKVRDSGGNVLANQPFTLVWCWISFSKQSYIINETEEILEVRLQRRGYLGETSFVTLSAENMTAMVGVDTTAWFAPQVQFNPGQTEKSWRIHLRDDDRFEGPEYFLLHLSDPVTALVENPRTTRINIQDYEDESVVTIPGREYKVDEKIGEILVPVRRTGDITDELWVICATVPDTATGTKDNQILSGSDYISRPDDQRSIIRFDTMQSERYCRVAIIDDSLYEEEEKFQVVLRETMGGRVGDGSSATVYIKPDNDDEPVFYFDKSTYTVDESGKQLDITIWRTGPDLSKPSSVTIGSRMTNPKSAIAGIDYIAVNNILDFAPGVTMNTVAVRILDDLGRPQIEGIEKFEVLLKGPRGASLGQPYIATININDTESDAPSMTFKDAFYEVREEVGHVKVTVMRTGDIRHASTVRCYTRQNSASVMMDYVERPDTDQSIVQFEPGEREKPCIVGIVNDTIYESNEEFRLVLGSPRSLTAPMATIGRINSTIIKLLDDSDKPVIRFAKRRFQVTEPRFIGTMGTVKIPVIREGDNSKVSRVQFSTKSGSALAGKDFNPLTRELYFGPNISQIITEIQILPDRDRENREVFTVHLKQYDKIVSELGRPTYAQVYIVENVKIADVVFPLRPRVVSLRDFDDIGRADTNPINGYPVVCVTACNPKHPDFPTTGKVCSDQKINDTLTKFRWRVAPPTVKGVTSPLRDVTSTTFFAPTWKITLDSVYYGAGSRVQCIATPVNYDGDPGRDVRSDPVTIDTENGLCVPMDTQTIGNEPFTAKLRYIGPGDREHPNSVKITVTIPHRDGLLPVISTHRPSNYEFILSPSAMRVGQHRCSNLLDITDHDVPFNRWFVSNATRNTDSIGEIEPYLYNPDVRTPSTLRFYRNLNLESCLWEFNGYFNMSELVDVCGGEIATDGQAINLKQSALTLRVPLYVSYVSHSPTATGWKHVDMETDMTLTFVYDTAILWQNGITSQESSGVKGDLFPTSVRVTDDNRLAVTFRTEANFRGMFIPVNKETAISSRVTSPDHPDLNFDLRLLRSDPTYENPDQLWEFTSKMAKEDYSGMYHISLIPCTTPIYQQYSLPIICNPQDHVTFELPIRFQQVSDPVPAEFSLSTDFNLMRKRSLWLSGNKGFGEDSDAAFAPGDKIYGRVDVTSQQNLGDQFKLNLEKVFICSGIDGYIPKYNPSQGEYGCLATSPNLQYSLKILDRRAPHTTQNDIDGLPLGAVMAADDPGAAVLLRQPGSDGFSLDTEPLFKSDTGRMWFLHTIYTIRSATSSTFRGRRSVTHVLHSPLHYKNDQEESSSRRSKRTPEDSDGMGQDGKGTNMARIVLSTTIRDDDRNFEVSEVANNPHNDGHSLIPILLGILIFFMICLIVVVVLIRRKRKHSSPPPSPTNTITLISKSGQTKVVQLNPDTNVNSDRTEV